MPDYKPKHRTAASLIIYFSPVIFFLAIKPLALVIYGWANIFGTICAYIIFLIILAPFAAYIHLVIDSKKCKDKEKYPLWGLIGLLIPLAIHAMWTSMFAHKFHLFGL